MAWMEQAWMVTAMITDFGNDFEHDRPRADLAIHGTILTHGVETYGTVVVRDGRIASVASDSNGPGANGRAPIDAVKTIQLRNDEILIPGIVDTHVHINEPGRTAWEGFACATRAAAAGGVTTILDMPLNSVPPTLTVEALRSKRSCALHESYVQVGFWGGVDASNLGRCGRVEPGAVSGIMGCGGCSVSNASSPPAALTNTVRCRMRNWNARCAKSLRSADCWSAMRRIRTI